jgi:hypothetical protein
VTGATHTVSEQGGRAGDSTAIIVILYRHEALSATMRILETASQRAAPGAGQAHGQGDGS